MTLIHSTVSTTTPICFIQEFLPNFGVFLGGHCTNLGEWYRNSFSYLDMNLYIEKKGGVKVKIQTSVEMIQKILGMP